MLATIHPKIVKDDPRIAEGFFHEVLKVGQSVEVDESVYDYFLGVLPPVAMPMIWKGRRYDFGSAEGLEVVIAWHTCEGKFYATQTDVMNRL